MTMRYCSDKAIPHSDWMERWSSEDKAKQMAFLLEEATRCQFCGTAEWEWTENRFAYEPIEERCHGCYLKEIVQEGEQRTPGVRVKLIPTSLVTETQRMGGVPREGD